MPDDVPVPTPLTLPEGYTQRPLTRADAAALAATIAASELVDAGEAAIEEADLVADWGRPSHDLAADSVAVLHGDAIVAYAEHLGGDRADATVHPDHRGRGLGTALAGWLADRAAELGQDVVGMPVVAGSSGDRLLAELGWEVRWDSWVLALPQGTTIPERPLPAGYAIRAATPAEHRAVWMLNEDTFLEWAQRDRETFEDWQADVVRRPGFEPWQVRVVTDPTGELVAFAVLQVSQDAGGDGYVARLGTRPDARNRGLAQALLVDAFALARRHGATRSTLATDSRTGALGLYRKVGMEVISTWRNRAVRVRG